YFHIGRKAMYKYAASDQTYQHLGANSLVMWEAIKWYSQNGYKSLCFGRTESENEGLRQFKAGWSAKERIINYYKYDLIKDTFMKDHHKVTELQSRVFKRMPVPFLNIIGSLLYKHVG